MAEEFPPSLSPVNLLAYLYNAFGVCGCSELDVVVGEVRSILEWHANGEDRCPYAEVYPGRPGLFYLMAGLLDALGLSEHGIAIRHPWLTERGKVLLDALRAVPVEEIEEAVGTAYDGAWYGERK